MTPLESGYWFVIFLTTIFLFLMGYVAYLFWEFIRR
jgi:hypothetical protein